MFMVGEVCELKTSSDHCIDRGRDPDHKDETCLVGAQGQGDTRWYCSEAEGQGDTRWYCGEAEAARGAVGSRPRGGSGDSEDMSGASETIHKPVNYQEVGEPVWREKTLMSPFAARPMAVAFIQEGRDTLQPFFKDYMDPQIRSLTKYSKPVDHESVGWVLWSSRGRETVKSEDCRVVQIEEKTTFKNPTRAPQQCSDQSAREEELMEEERVEAELDEEKPMDLSEEVEENKMEQSEEEDSVARRATVQKRLQAFKYLSRRGDLKELKIDSENMPKLKSVIDKFNCLVE
jgi:hypothetical protein